MRTLDYRALVIRASGLRAVSAAAALLPVAPALGRTTGRRADGEHYPGSANPLVDVGRRSRGAREPAAGSRTRRPPGSTLPAGDLGVDLFGPNGD